MKWLSQSVPASPVECKMTKNTEPPQVSELGLGLGLASTVVTWLGLGLSLVSTADTWLGLASTAVTVLGLGLRLATAGSEEGKSGAVSGEKIGAGSGERSRGADGAGSDR